MARHFEVVGVDDDDDVQGDVMGDVMGYGGPMGDYEGGAAVVGHDRNGYPIVSGAPRRRPRGQHQVIVQKPGWRQSQLAPGVIAPDQGLLTLPMGNFTFTATAQTNTFQGQVQKPFRGERWLSRVVRTGTTATGTILAQLFVGTDLAMLDVASIDLESLANPGAFGVRLTMKPAQPGVFIRALCTLDTVLTTTDTIKVSLQLLGRNIH
jgi:hypothetical protein